MSVLLNQNETELQLDELISGTDEAFVDTIWLEMDQKIPRQQVRIVAAEVALGYQDAKVKLFLPVLVHRRVIERLCQESSEYINRDNKGPDG